MICRSRSHNRRLYKFIRLTQFHLLFYCLNYISVVYSKTKTGYWLVDIYIYLHINNNLFKNLRYYNQYNYLLIVNCVRLLQQNAHRLPEWSLVLHSLDCLPECSRQGLFRFSYKNDGDSISSNIQLKAQF